LRAQLVSGNVEGRGVASVLEITTDIMTGEAAFAARALAARRGLPRWKVLAVSYGLPLLAFVVILSLVGLTGSLPIAWTAAVIATIATSILAPRLLQAIYKKSLSARGFGPRYPIILRLAPEGLSYRFGEVLSTAPWSAVTELIYSKGFWMFLVQDRTFFLPARALADPEAERDFLREALACMTKEAKARSGAAVKAAERFAVL
jgi:hypothetical protein